MPSIRKRIGYLPSQNVQELISFLAGKEMLSQSKVVGLLVEEALIARGLFDLQNTNNIIRKNSYKKLPNINHSSYKYNDLDALISDKGITYNSKNHNYKTNVFSSEDKDDNHEDMFELFKQFMLFKKTLEEK